MKQSWRGEIFRLCLWLIAGIVVGSNFGYPILGLTIGCVIYCCWLLFSLRQLIRWLDRGAVGPPPYVKGIGEHIGVLVYARQRRNIKRRRRLADMVSSFRDSMASIPDGLVLIDNHRNIEWFNNAAKEYLSLDYPTDIGQRIDNLVRHPTFTDYIVLADHHRSIDIHMPMSSAPHQEIRLLPFGADQQLIIIRDASLLHRLQKVRSDFVINASHELRTPLTVMRGYMEAVESDEAMPDDLRFPIKEVSRQVGRMDRLVHDLLELASLERDDARLVEKVINMPSLIHGMVKEAYALSGEKAHQIHVNADENLGLWADEKAVFSAVSNLVFNAVHYTPAGGNITINWCTDEHHVVLSVEDDGPGIAEHHLSRLSERFYRVDVSRSRDSGGTGLGLSIVRHVMMSHGGELQIESELGRGSCFGCYFPLKRVHQLDKRLAADVAV